MVDPHRFGGRKDIMNREGGDSSVSTLQLSSGEVLLFISIDISWSNVRVAHISPEAAPAKVYLRRSDFPPRPVILPISL